MAAKEIAEALSHRDGSDRDRNASFERVALPHLKSAFHLARWLTRDGHDAEDVMQEAYLRAYKYFDGFHGNDGRTWLLSIVRNTFYTWRERQPARADRRPSAGSESEDDSADALSDLPSDREPSPDAEMLRACDRRLVDEAIGELSAEFREVIVLRELEELSYKEIAAVVDVPLGTVMSRLARGREYLRQLLQERIDRERKP
jgi:RNA polymerase sigma factor (sigma-70 family)